MSLKGPDNGKGLDNARFAQPRDLPVIVTELREHAAGTLPHFVWRVLDRRSSMRELERGQRHPHRTIDNPVCPQNGEIRADL